MVIYTCVKNINTDYYECYNGIKEFEDSFLEDFRMISIPSTNLQFEIFKQIMDKQALTYTLKKKVILVQEVSLPQVL
jgi:hypothetical protein